MTTVIPDDEFDARAMSAIQWTWPLQLLNLGVIDQIWPVAQSWIQSEKDKWVPFIAKIKQWFTPARRALANQQAYLDSLWAAADWAAAQCGISNWRTTWPGVGA